MAAISRYADAAVVEARNRGSSDGLGLTLANYSKVTLITNNEGLTLNTDSHRFTRRPVADR
jgi:hypothetical protein